MSDPPREPAGPRVILEDGPTVCPGAPRLDFGWERAVVPVTTPRPGSAWASVGYLALGAAVLVLGLSALDAANFVVAQFARADWLGWLTLGITTLGYGLVAWAGLREWRGLLSLRSVERARAAFARGDAATAKAEALRWAARIPAAQTTLPALRQAQDTETLRAILQSGPLAALDQQVTALGRAAAIQSFAVAAISPSAGLDALLVGWRGLRLVRQVAVLHGLRPGLAATMKLLRRTLLDAATVAATDVAVDAAARALLTNPLLEKVAGEAATGAVAARRMLLLSRAASEACRIVPRTP